MNYYNEFDPHAAAWLKQLIAEGLIPPGEVDQRSILDVRPHELIGYTQQHFFAGIGGWSLALRIAGVPDDFPVRTGSCPCQPFSQQGQQKAEKDERHLWPVFRDIITFGDPTVTFGEQVASKLGREWLSGVRLDLEGLGYEVGAADLCAARYSPHGRQRLYWVANPKHKRMEVRRRVTNPQRQHQGPARVCKSIPPGLSIEEGSLVGEGVSPRTEWPGKPQTTWLPHGIPARVVRVRGYGNAIVPQVAAEFIKAFLTH